MKVRFECSGGWGNPLGKVCDLDTNELAPPEADQLERLVRQSRVEASIDARSPDVRDAVNYDVTIEIEGRSVSIRADDATVPDHIVPLIEFLEKLARPRSLK